MRDLFGQRYRLRASYREETDEMARLRQRFNKPAPTNEEALARAAYLLEVGADFERLRLALKARIKVLEEQGPGSRINWNRAKNSARRTSPPMKR
jgi:hypothetical protein